MIRIPVYCDDRITFMFRGHMWAYDFIMDDFGNAIPIDFVPYTWWMINEQVH